MEITKLLLRPNLWRSKWLCYTSFKIAALGYNDKQVLWKYAQRVRDGNIVEIGSFRGGSAQLFGTANTEANIYCVDPWDIECEGYIYNGDIYKEFSQNVTNFKNVIPLRGKSDVVAQLFSERINLLFIDGDHSYRGCLTDLQSWYPKLAAASYCILHDANREGVRRAIIDYFGTFDLGMMLTHQMYVIEKDERLAEYEDKA